MTTSTNPETLSKLSLEELQKQLKTSTQGLSTKEASDRQVGIWCSRLWLKKQPCTAVTNFYFP